MAGIVDLFIPREKKFFDYLNKQIILLDDCIKKLSKLQENENLDLKELQKSVNCIGKKSKEGDVISTEIINLLHQTFITPIDREEIKSLSLSIHFIVNSVKKIVTSILFFKINKLDSNFVKQLRILEESVDNLKLIFKDPLDSKKNKLYISKVNKLENEADALFGKSIGELFNNGFSPIEIIKHKELYELTEDAIDDVKHIADIVETVLINNS